jgi:hypothetical protein
MNQPNRSIAGAQAAAAVAGVIVVAVTVPLFGLVMLPLVALAAAGRGIASLANAAGTVHLVE